jgi:K+ transporter
VAAEEAQCAAERTAPKMPTTQLVPAKSSMVGMPAASCRVPGTAVYLTPQRDLVPSALALNLKHNGVLQERLLLLKVTTERAPRVAENTRVIVEELSKGIRRVEVRFGFAEKPDVPAALRRMLRRSGATRLPRRSSSGGRFRSLRYSRNCPCGRNGSTLSWCAMPSAPRITS